MQVIPDLICRANWGGFRDQSQDANDNGSGNAPSSIDGSSGCGGVDNDKGPTRMPCGIPPLGSTEGTINRSSINPPDAVAEKVPNPTSPTRTTQVAHESTLEELYQQYPDKQLSGIPPESILSVIDTFRQVAANAARAWIRNWYPETEGKAASCGECRGSKSNTTHSEAKSPAQPIPSAEKGQQQTGRRGNIYDLHRINRIPPHALNLMPGTSTATQLFRKCIIDPVEEPPRTTQLRQLKRTLDPYIQFCRVLRDFKRMILLERAKHKIQRIFIRLNVERLQRHSLASQKYIEHIVQYGVGGEIMSKNPGLAPTASSKLENARRSAEERILDEAAEGFEQFRLVARVKVFEAMDSLLVKSSSAQTRQGIANTLSR